MKALIVNETGIGKDTEVYGGKNNNLNLTHILDIYGIEFDDIMPCEGVKCTLRLRLDFMKLHIKDITADFASMNGSIDDLDIIIEEFQKLRVLMTKEQEKES